MKNKVIVALDLRGFNDIVNLVDILGEEAIWYKIGSVNFTSYSNRLIETLKGRNKKIFLDLKYHDIPNTIKEAAFSACEIGVDMFTIHSVGGVDMMKAARDGVKLFEDRYAKKGPVILAVTILTSFTKETIKRDMFLDMDVEDMVLRLAENAKRAGIDGLVASPKETSLLRENFDNYFTIVTPGIRPSDSLKNDQKRVTTPKEAIKTGSDYIVVGRPIYLSSSPADSFSSIIKEMEEIC